MAGMVKKSILLSLLLWFASCSPPGILISGNIDYTTFIHQNGKLNNLLQTLSPAAEYALIIGSDGTAVLVTAKSFSEIEIYKKADRWFSKTEKLPPVCNIKDIKEICVYSQVPAEYNSFEERFKDFEFLGQSSKNDHYVRKYKEIYL
ncbi:MAG: hypothetical protein K9N07_02235 [Candidatus Cloacimonetes bacterium]|nr:hypothetical protein [Candidatus Cloacimonadota bacterium]